MIIGRFGDTSGRPYIEGRIVVPSQGVSTNISFILDTGADACVLMPLDGARLGLDYARLATSHDTLGVGGRSKDFLEPALITFFEQGVGLHVYSIDLIVSSPSPEIMRIPSLLGRNVIDNWRVTYDPSNDKLEAEVLKADVTLPAAPSPSAPPMIPGVVTGKPPTT